MRINGAVYNGAPLGGDRQFLGALAVGLSATAEISASATHAAAAKANLSAVGLLSPDATRNVFPAAAPGGTAEIHPETLFAQAAASVIDVSADVVVYVRRQVQAEAHISVGADVVAVQNGVLGSAEFTGTAEVSCAGTRIVRAKAIWLDSTAEVVCDATAMRLCEVLATGSSDVRAEPSIRLSGQPNTLHYGFSNLDCTAAIVVSGVGNVIKFGAVDAGCSATVAPTAHMELRSFAKPSGRAGVEIVSQPEIISAPRANITVGADMLSAPWRVVFPVANIDATASMSPQPSQGHSAASEMAGTAFIVAPAIRTRTARSALVGLASLAADPTRIQHGGATDLFGTAIVIAGAMTNVEAYDPPWRTMYRQYVDRVMYRPTVDREMRRRS